MPVALVVGASRGIGRAIALELARTGHDLWLTYRSSDEAARDVAAEVAGLGRTAELLKFDVADLEQTRQALAERALSSPPDVVVFNAGITRDGLLALMGPDDWNAVLRTNLDGFYNLMNAVLRGLVRARRGRIIAISSTSGEVGQAGQVNYSASKAGLIGAVKALAREVGKRGILVNVVSPGLIETDMTKDLPLDQMLPMIPVGRVGTAEEVAGVVAFLASDAASYIHGQVIGVNGGLAI